MLLKGNEQHLFTVYKMTSVKHKGDEVKLKKRIERKDTGKGKYERNGIKGIIGRIKIF